MSFTCIQENLKIGKGSYACHQGDFDALSKEDLIPIGYIHYSDHIIILFICIESSLFSQL